MDGSTDGPGRATRPDAELLQSGASIDVASRVWRPGPRQQRRLATAVAVALAVALALGAAARARSWLVDRGLRDSVVLSTSLGVSSSSSSPAGGRVDYYVSVRNAGPRPVRVVGVEGVAAGLHMRSRAGLPQQVVPGQTIDVPVSVRLDCTARGTGARGDDLRAAVEALPLSGRRRDVGVLVSRAALLTDGADVLCQVRPDLADRELSGPVL